MRAHQECEFLGSHVPGIKGSGAGPACVPGGGSEGPQEELRACLVVEENGSDLCHRGTAAWPCSAGGQEGARVGFGHQS